MDEQTKANYLASREADLRKYVRAANRWFAEVDRRIAGLEPKRVAMPSKARKGHAYDDAHTIVTLRGGDWNDNRISTFPQMCALIGEPCNVRILDTYAGKI